MWNRFRESKYDSIDCLKSSSKFRWNRFHDFEVQINAFFCFWRSLESDIEEPYEISFKRLMTPVVKATCNQIQWTLEIAFKSHMTLLSRVVWARFPHSLKSSSKIFGIIFKGLRNPFHFFSDFQIPESCEIDLWWPLEISFKNLLKSIASDSRKTILIQRSFCNRFRESTDIDCERHIGGDFATPML